MKDRIKDACKANAGKFLVVDVEVKTMVRLVMKADQYEDEENVLCEALGLWEDEVDTEKAKQFLHIKRMDVDKRDVQIRAVAKDADSAMYEAMLLDEHGDIEHVEWEEDDRIFEDMSSEEPMLIYNHYASVQLPSEKEEED